METPAPRDLRVLQVMECTIGGTRRHLTDLARGLNGSGVEVHLAVAAERQESFRETLVELAAQGCVVHEIPMRRSISPVTDARQLFGMQKLLRELQPDIVHTHSSKAGVLGRLASYTTGLGKRVHTPHTFAFLFEEMFKGPKRKLFFELEKQLSGLSDALVAVSPSEAATFARSGVVAREKIHVVPNGIDPAPFAAATPAGLAEFGLDPGRPVASIIGLLNVAKGQDLALRALASRPELRDLQLLIVGHGETEVQLRALASELQVAERVAFAGFRRDVPELLAASDFVLLPSRWEGMPYIVLEAMAAARGVVATPVDGALDLLEDGTSGWLAGEISVPAIADSLTRVLALPAAERAAVGVAARERVLSRFTEQTMVRGLLDLYASLLERPTP